jgi:hypothetical protein
MKPEAEEKFKQYEKIYLEATVMEVGMRKGHKGNKYPIYEVAVDGKKLVLTDRSMVKKERAK